jgi:hypothetical protein
MKVLILSCLASVLLSLGVFSQVVVIPAYTPKPLNAHGVENPVINLNGTWDFSPAPGLRFWKSPGRSGVSWTSISVPSEWVMQGFTVTPGTRAAYHRSIEIPADWAGSKILLKCDGLYSDAQVYINGKFAGTHQGGFTPAEFVLTEFAVPGKKNNLVIGLISESLADTLASASQYAAHPLGGITRKLELYALPQIHIRSCNLTTDLDDNFRDAFLEIDLSISQSDKPAKGDIEAEVKLTSCNSASQQPIVRSYPLKLLPTGGIQNRKLMMKVFNPTKWDPEHPELYEVQITLRNGGEVLESVKYKIGFREIQVVGNQVFVNGKPIKLRGVCRHEVHPAKGRSLTMDEWRADVRLFKEANVNYIRTSHYPPAEEFISLCDSAGFFVELEAPLCWVGHGANIHWASANPHDMKLYHLIRQQVLESLGQYRNHPSVLMWSMANESQWGPIWDSIRKELNLLDPTRPVSFHDQAYGGYNNNGSSSVQVANFHYPGPAGPEMARNFERPLLFGEYCHLNCYNRQETVTDPGVRDDWGRGLESMFENMYNSRGNLGGAIWSGIDDIFYLPGGKAVGYGEWGPIDGWRRPKPEYWHLKKTYSPVKIGVKTLPLPAPGKPVRVAVENRNLFSNLNELDIRWRINSQSGAASVWAEPGQTGVMVIYPDKPLNQGDLLEIQVWSPQKFLVDSYIVRLGQQTDRSTGKFLGAGLPSLKQEGGYITVTAGNFVWVFDSGKGRLIEAGQKGGLVLAGSPELQMLPLTTGPCVTDYKLDIEPLNDLCSNPTYKPIESGVENGRPWVRTVCSYDQADLIATWSFDDSGKAQIQYEIKSKVEMNPRQVGLVFSLPREIEMLSWEREALWTVYPADHIGRPEGHAIPVPADDKGIFRFGIQPAWNWSADRNPLGSNDFRSTRENIFWAELSSLNSHGLRIDSDGKDAVRCWVDSSGTHMLVASFFTGGGDMFFSSHHQKERKPIKPGDVWKGTVHLSLK